MRAAPVDQHAAVGERDERGELEALLLALAVAVAVRHRGRRLEDASMRIDESKRDPLRDVDRARVFADVVVEGDPHARPVRGVHGLSERGRGRGPTRLPHAARRRAAARDEHTRHARRARDVPRVRACDGALFVVRVVARRGVRARRQRDDAGRVDEHALGDGLRVRGHVPRDERLSLTIPRDGEETRGARGAGYETRVAQVALPPLREQRARRDGWVRALHGVGSSRAGAGRPQGASGTTQRPLTQRWFALGQGSSAVHAVGVVPCVSPPA